MRRMMYDANLLSSISTHWTEGGILFRGINFSIIMKHALLWTEIDFMAP